ncbi:hypothetical protein DSM110277_01646 [Sulfitobacter pontiacus]|uniref:DUF3990 domain-containing protein n=1 Tax=Sulfitobacter pontiacus TaxID=60137 RepID=A0AAX3AD89_9RHOB|nr:hypothetical protein [Sulfitobacter pontiacus]UOA23232.1 hypothetical protein DSM110277_01646 [Sulfitobacter pontiacus]
MPNFDYKSTFHGTSAAFASDLVEGKVDVSNGGGELGQGFYVGDKLYVAKAWAKQKFDSETVVEFRMNDDDFWNFDIEALSYSEAIQQRVNIKAMGTQRSHLFGKDVVWGPIVGGPDIYCDQEKWESGKGQNHLNGRNTGRRIR